MKLITHDEKRSIYILRLDRGDELKETLAQFCTENKITAGYFSGIGSTDNCVLAYYDAQQKQYIDHTFIGHYEVISIHGNISLIDENPLIHAHVVISGSDMTAKAGHVQSLMTYITNEIMLQKLDGAITRKHSPEDNLFLIK
ncbi:MAG TPA: hypothetical protein DCS29_01270 [Candidatus Magasanikbacteria bacterium]|nr:MAG: hypothetical protein A2479_01480 [Candidatus Magasanikbacteria bacterium RIFOXYC2_FULL_39_8]HAT03392.1 hypothetical protein [Candidatus Magasanikbacteria bacterium]